MSIEEIIARRREQQALDAGSPSPAPASFPAPEVEADPDEQPEQRGVERIISQRRAREQGTALAIRRAAGVEPESRRKAQILAKEFGAPLFLIESDLPKFEQRYKEKRTRQLVQRMPALAAEMNDPSAPTVLEDAELLADLDERLKPPEIDMGLLARGPEAARRQARSIRQSTLGWKIGFNRASEEERAEYEYLRANPPTPLKNQPGPWDEIVEATGGILPYAVDVGIAGAEGYAVGAVAGAGIGALAGGVPGALAGAQQAGSAASRGAALYRITQIEGGGIYDSLRDIADEIKAETGQDVPPAVIQGMMATGGITNGMLESFALGRFAKMFPGGKFVLAKIARPELKATLLDATKRATLARVGTKLLQGLEATGTNAVQEGLQGMAPRIAARALTRAYLDPNAPLWTAEDSRGVVEDAIMGAAGGFGISALGAGSSAITRVVTQPFVDSANLDRLNHMVEKANESKLAAENPDVFRRIVGRANDGKDGDRAIFVAPDVLASVLGSERLAELPDLEDGIREATATRGEVVIRLEDYVTDLREFHQALSKNIRVGLAGATQQEIGFADRVAAELAAAEEGREALTPAEQSSEQIYSFMFEASVRDGKMSIEEARAHATTFQKHITTLAAEVGEDPWAFFQANVPLRVEGPPSRAEVTAPSLATRLSREDMASTLATLQTGQTPMRFPSFPVLDILKRNGGVDPASTLAGELRHMGVTSQTHPGLYRQGGLESLDDLDVADEPVLLGHVRIADGDYRADPRDLLDAIDKELRGEPLRSEEQAEALEAVEGPARELGRHLEELGIDPQNATVEQVLELLQRSGIHRPEAGEENVEEDSSRNVLDTTLEQPAYHGSPHRFSDFDITKIGTGEGAQAYGWGLYFTTARGIAAFYRNTLSRRTYSYRGVEIGPEHLTFQGVAEQMERAGISVSESALVFRVMEAAGSAMADANDPQTWIDEAARRQRAFATIAERKREGEPDQSVAANYRLNAARLELLAPADFATAQGGQIVEVELPEDSNLLAWEKPLARQHADVKAALKRAGITQRFKAGQSDYSAPRGTRTDNGEGIYDFLTHELGSQQAASKALLAAGIVGHSYKAGQTAVAPTTTRDRNFVIYDDKAVRVAQTFYQDARGSISFDHEFRNVVIQLSQSKDASTFIHESGHLFLELMLRTAERPDASQRLKDNAVAALTWLGTADRASITREMHEQFARGYEAYLLEGKAPSLALRDTFARFTTWLLRVYRSLTQLNVTLTDDIRGVFDRMLASDEAIVEARRVQGFMPAFKDAQTAGMTEDEFAAYELAHQRTYDDARRKLMRETLKDLDDRKKAEYLEERERITQQVTLDVNSRPVFRARGWLSTGKVPEGTVGPELEHRKLDREKLVRLKGKGILKVFRPGKYQIWQKEGGHDPEMIARVFGFDSADRMLNAFATTASRQEVIALEVQERLARRFGDVFRDGRLPELAIEASMTNDQGEFLVAELRALRRQIQTKDEREQGRELPLRVIKRAARQQIEGRKVRDLREDIYRAAEQRAAMRAAEAILKRDFQTAADEKRAELLNHYLAIEARDAREKADKDRAYLLRMGGKDARARLGKAGHDYLAQVDALLFRFKFGPVTKAASEGREALADWIIAQEKAGAVLQIDSQLRNEAFTVDWKGMTVGELESLADAVRSIEHQAQRKNKLILGKQRREFAETREQAVASIGQNTVRDVRHLDPRDSTVDALQSFARSAHGIHTKLEALFKRLDGGKLGFMWELCFKPFADAEAAEQEWLGELSGTLEGIFKKLRKAEGSWRGKVFVPEINRSLSYEKMIVIALNQGNEYNKNALLEGEGWNQQQVDAVLGLLTEADWTAAREIAALVESTKERSFALHERLAGVRPEAVEPSDVVTRFGVFPGWYWPLKADSLRSHVALKREEAQSSQDLFQGNAFKPMTRQGHLIARADFGKQPVLLSLSVLSEHLFNVVHDVTHREALIQVDRITQDAAVAGAITDAVGREMYLQLRPWLKGIAGERLAPVAAIESTLGYIRQGVSISYMGLKASVLLSQGLAVFQAMGPEGVGPVRFMREMQTFLTSPLEAQRRVNMALALSPALRARLTNFDRDARDAVKRGIFATSSLGEAHADFVQFAMGAIGLADMVVTVPTWLAAYGRALEEGATVERAVAEADSLIRLTMGAGGAKDLAAVQRGGELLRTLTGFYSAMSAIYNQFGLTIAAIRDGRMSLPQVALAAMFMWILPALAQPLLARQGPDDDESLWKWAFTEIMFFPASLVIGLRDVSGYAERRVKGEYSDLSLPALDALETSVNATIGVAVDLAANGELSRKNAKDIVNAIGVWGHLPSRQAWITAEALYDLAYDQGEVDVMKGDLVLARPPERRAQ